VAEPREELVPVGGVKIQTLVGGQGEPLVVLHGAGGSPGWRWWHAALAERYTVYAPTHPGFGQSDSADWMESVRDLARLYLWYFDLLGLERVHLLGHSMGGWTAVELAAMNPRAVDRLVLVASVGLKPEEGEILDIFYHSPEQVRAAGFFDPAQAPEYDELYGQPPTPEQLDLQLRNREMAARLTWKPYMYNPRLPHYLARVTNPTLVVWGREDGIVPAICGEQYQRLLPNATLRVFERCGHSPQLERREQFVELVNDFLGSSTVAASGGAAR
jgi:pimeloyl-ACP methyl ester carboxylesterase